MTELERARRDVRLAFERRWSGLFFCEKLAEFERLVREDERQKTYGTCPCGEPGCNDNPLVRAEEKP